MSCYSIQCTAHRWGVKGESRPATAGELPRITPQRVARAAGREWHSGAGPNLKTAFGRAWLIAHGVWRKRRLGGWGRPAAAVVGLPRLERLRSEVAESGADLPGARQQVRSHGGEGLGGESVGGPGHADGRNHFPRRVVERSGDGVKTDL